MAKVVICEGKTSSEAIEKGLKQIGLPKELVEIKILEENKKNFFDILAPKVVKVEIKEKEIKKPETHEIQATEQDLNKAKENIDRFLKEFLNKISQEIQYSVKIEENFLCVTISGENIGNLIGYRGEVLFALENIIKAVANRKTENKVIVRLDIEKYKEKRIKTLEELAIKKASIVEKTGKAITLEPMQAYERKIIHNVLQNRARVETRSYGQEPRRRIVISKK